MTEEDVNDDEENGAYGTPHVLEPYVIFGSIFFWAAAGYWLHQQEFSVREDWLGRLALFGFLSPFVALLIPPLAAVFIILAGVTFCILGLAYSSDIGPDSHFLTGALLFLSGIVCVAGSIMAAKIRPVLINAGKRLWQDETHRAS